MHCDDARAAWTAQRYSPSPDDAAHAHIQSCAACTAYIAQQQALDGLLRHDTNEPPGLGFDTRFFARLQEAKTKPRRLRSWLLAGVLATACALTGVLLWPRAAVPPQDVELALNMDLLQEDVGMLQQLHTVEDFELLSKVPAGDPAFAPQVPR